ncbi:MAG: hypothetical protein JO270_04755 [Acidobacteriaceae bacterium]|nr:hypothetical protein [Acidobacteriaceae bacterium]MBV8572943.1 hypothetical protein [Acidobacteriaceae bacterium]
MEKAKQDNTYTDLEGRTHFDIEALLRDPKVQETIRKVSRITEQARKRGGMSFLRYRKPD